jgi:hypothetical protein
VNQLLVRALDQLPVRQWSRSRGTVGVVSYMSIR